MHKNLPRGRPFVSYAGPLGIGPRLAVLETAVLPLYDGPVPYSLPKNGVISKELDLSIAALIFHVLYF